MTDRQRTRALVGAAGIGALLLLGGSTAWYVRPIVSARRVGISWQPTLEASHCTTARDEVSCTTDWPVTGRRLTSTTLLYKPLTRELLRADRTWNLTDSAAWVRVIDSTQRALNGRGWERLPCDTAVMRVPIADAWRLGAHEIRFYAWPQMREGGIVERRFATVQLVAFGAHGCEPRYGVRLLTPAEMAQTARAWLAKQVGF